MDLSGADEDELSLSIGTNSNASNESHRSSAILFLSILEARRGKV